MGYILIILSVAALVISGWSMIRKINCKKEIDAVFVKNHPMSGKKKNSQFAPVFRYDWNGTSIEESSFECFGEDQLGFYSGETYTIYVNEKRPKDFVVDRSINREDLFLFAVSLLCTIVVGLLLFL